MADDKLQIAMAHFMKSREQALYLSFVICHLSFLNPKYLPPSIRLL